LFNNYFIKIIAIIYIIIFISSFNVGCTTYNKVSTKNEISTQNEVSTQNDIVKMTKEQKLETYLLETKSIHGFSDREIYEINKPVFATWGGCSCHIAIFPLDDMGEWIVEEGLKLAFIGVYYYEHYGEYGIKAHYVEKFMKEINELCANGALLNSFVMKDLIVTMEFSDGSKLVFDRYYVELVNHLDDYPNIFSIINHYI